MPTEEERLGARRTAGTMAMIFALGASLSTLQWAVKGFHFWHWDAAIVITWSLFLYIKRMPQITVRGATYVWFGSLITVLIASGLTNHIIAEQKLIAMSFGGHKVAAIIVALVAPASMRSTAVALALCGLLPFLHFGLVSPEAQKEMLPLEPTLTLAVAVGAAVVYRQRLRAKAQEQELYQVVRQRANLDHLARIFIAVRDLTNTPLQSIELTTALLEMQRITPEQAVGYLRKAMERLQILSRILGEQERNLSLPEADKGFDAGAFLAAEIAKLQSQLQQ